MDCRLIFDAPAAGAWNMAVDESLLATASGGGQGACLRFYTWAPPTVSLGYFQRYGDRHRHAPSCRAPLVRRSTGGGAIVHDIELTYSFTIPIESRVALSLRGYYDTFHEELIGVLARLGIRARQWSDGAASGNPQEEPFLCFQRRAVGDVLIADTKVAGSAQRRRQNALLQHGSVLLSRSVAAPELAGIRDLSGMALAADALADRWAESVSRRLGMRMHSGVLTVEERRMAERLVVEKFAHPSWTQRR